MAQRGEKNEPARPTEAADEVRRESEVSPELDVDVPVDDHEAAPVDGFERSDPADLDERTIGDSGDLDAGLGTDIDDGRDRLGELGDYDPVPDFELKIDVGDGNAGDPESAHDAGRGAAGDETVPAPTPYPGSGDRVKLSGENAGPGRSAGMGDEAGTLSAHTKPVDNVAEFGTARSKIHTGEEAEPVRLLDDVDDAPPPLLVVGDQIDPGEGGGAGPEIPISFDPDDVVDGPDNDLDGDDGVTDPYDDPAGASVAGGPDVDHSIHYDVDPNAVDTDAAMLPGELSPEGGDIDFGDF